MTTEKDLKAAIRYTIDLTPQSTMQDRMKAALLHKLKIENDKANVLKIDEKVTVKYHQMDMFMKMFPDHYHDHLNRFRESLAPKYNRDMVFKAGEGAGRSGSFFFFSHDRQFIIKTMTQGELDLYLKKLPAFAEHFANNKNSLIAKIFGVFTVNTKFMKEVHVMLMENTMQLKNPTGLTHIFDLKGSLVDRKTKGEIKPSTTLKDINFLNYLKYRQSSTLFNKSHRTYLISAMRKDVDFLQ